jgi:NADH-quinone oxidoreductase subunit C
MTDEPDKTDPTEGEDSAGDSRRRAQTRADDKSPSPAGGVERAGAPPDPSHEEAAAPTPESQAALTGKAPSGSSSSGTTMPAAPSGESESQSAPAAKPQSAAPPANETPEEKKARLERVIAEAKAKKAAAAGTASPAAEGGETPVSPQPPGGASPATSDAEKAAKIAAAKAKAAALKAAAGDKPAPPQPAAAGATAAGTPGAPKAPVKKKEEGPKPADASGHALVRRLRAKFADAVTEATEFLGQLSVRVERARIVEVCDALRRDAGTPFDLLCDLTCVHYPENFDAPFEIVYNLYSIRENARVRLKVATTGEEGVESVSAVWPTANWMEREVYDLFGIKFANHPDLRRLLLPDDWDGHPLRKDYPLEAMENDWTARHLPEFTDVQREQLEQRRAYGLEILQTPAERRVREIFRGGKEVMPKEHR